VYRTHFSVISSEFFAAVLRVKPKIVSLGKVGTFTKSGDSAAGKPAVLSAR